MDSITEGWGRQDREGVVSVVGHSQMIGFNANPMNQILWIPFPEVCSVWYKNV